MRIALRAKVNQLRMALTAARGLFGESQRTVSDADWGVITRGHAGFRHRRRFRRHAPLAQRYQLIIGVQITRLVIDHA